VKEMISTIAGTLGTGIVSAYPLRATECSPKKRLNSPKTREIGDFKIFEGGPALLGL
jgi:hypothetical protein